LEIIAAEKRPSNAIGAFRGRKYIFDWQLATLKVIYSPALKPKTANYTSA